MPGYMAGVNNNGKIGVLFQGRYTAYIENICCSGLESVGTELAKNHLFVVYGKKILCRHEKLLNDIYEASFFKQCKNLHFSGYDLNDISIICEQVNFVRIHHFGGIG
jgi:hypothetical protein